jgi:hypothetical protein
MGAIQEPRPVLLILAASSRYDEALDWAQARLVADWGPVALASPRFEFTETQYYEPTMGTGIRKVLWAFEPLVDPGRLAELKHYTNRCEDEFRGSRNYPESRPVNLDPGYLSEAKLVLATTKDRDHRVYLSQGIYAEVTLHYRHREWQSFPWTYPDYQRSDYHQFLIGCRDFLRQQYVRTILRPQSDSA